MVLATVATDLHQLGQALAADLIGSHRMGCGRAGNRTHGLRRDLGAAARAVLSAYEPGQP